MEEKFEKSDLFRVGGVGKYEGVYGESTCITCPLLLKDIARFMLTRILLLYGEGYKIVGESVSAFWDSVTLYTNLPHDEAFNVSFPIGNEEFVWDVGLVDELADFLS